MPLLFRFHNSNNLALMESSIRITPATGSGINMRELWQYRDLVYFLSWRDIRVKYKHTSLGVLWAVLQPLLLMTIFYFVFFRTLDVRTRTEYPVHAFGGLVLWGLFSGGISNSCENMITSAQMIRKIYFPRLIIPLASFASALVDFIIAFIVFLIILIVFRQTVSASALFYFPLAVILVVVSAFGIGTITSALTVKFRDFRYIMPFAMQIVFFSSQIIYSIDRLHWGWLKNILYVNPLNGALEIFFYPMQEGILNIQGITISTISAFCLLSAGLFYFKRTEKHFADII
jgi:lipopolysaccharide transport system permease protein